jgi:hypothetical protein
VLSDDEQTEIDDAIEDQIMKKISILTSGTGKGKKNKDNLKSSNVSSHDNLLEPPQFGE